MTIRHFSWILALLCTTGAIAEPLSPGDVSTRAIERRAVEAVVWGMPAVNSELMYDEMLKAGGKPGQIIYWGRPLDWRNQTLTPNPDTLYFMGFFDTKASGPMVVEIPPAGDDGSLNGNFVTLWQTSLEDAGLLGVDKGKGVKFVITPPAYAGKIPDGFEQLASDTYGGYFLLRSNLKSHSDADVRKSIAYGKRVKFYPLSQIDNPPETIFIDVKDKDFDSTIRYDASFFALLNRAVQSEPWIERDRAMIDQLRSNGIEKGKAFAPDEATSKALESGISEAKAWLAARYDAGFPAFYEGAHWTMPSSPEAIQGQSTTYADPDKYAVDARGLAYSYAYIAIKRLGVGQYYLIAIKDKDGESYDGGKTYRLHVPPNPPVEQYWSVTAYDRETHALIKGMDRASRASNANDLQKNADGSVDVWFGPKAPEGKESNWVPTDPNRRFELMFRLYGPTKDLFDRTWRLPDVEKIAEARQNKVAERLRPVAVTADNFVRAESDIYFGGVVKDGGLGKFNHHRELAAIDHQTVIRMNRDTLYSAAILDLDAGPVTITLPDAGGRFMSMQVIDEDEYTPMVVYRPGKYTLTKDQIGTRYVLAAVRTFVDPNSAQDLAVVHALQDAIAIDQPGGPGAFEIPRWDPVSQKKTRDALLALASNLADTKGMFGPKGKVDPVRHLIGAASAWGGNPEEDALYLNVTPAKNDRATTYRLEVKDVPVDGFWSISVYNANGYFEKNALGAYSLNNVTTKKRADGSVDVQFGGCEGNIPNCLPTSPGWNYLVRLYRPRAEILTGAWKFPEAQRVN